MLVDEGDKLNQMAPFPVVPVYSPHALMKTLRLAQRRVYVCVRACVCVSTKTDILLQIASCWLWGLLCQALCCTSAFSAFRFNPCLIWCASECACLCAGMCTLICCVCLLLFFPGADHFIHLCTIIKPIMKVVLPYDWTSLFLHSLF